MREKIADVQLRELAQVRRAPLRKQSQLQAVSEYLTRLAAGAAENRVDARGNARVMWAEDMVAGKDDVLGLLAFALGPEQLLAAFSRDLELEPEPCAYRKSNPDIFVMQCAEDWAAKNTPCPFYGAR